MKVVIAGGGSVGVAIATDLAERNHDVVILEQSSDIVLKIREQIQSPHVKVEQCDACEVKSLAKAGVQSADVMIAATGDDEDNLVISWLARSQFAVGRVIARVNNSRNEWLFNENWGVDVAVSIPSLITSLVDEVVEVGSVVSLLEVAQGRMELVEVTLDSDAPVILSGATLDEIGLPDVARVLTIVRDDVPLAALPTTTFLEHDHVLLLVRKGESDCLRGVLTRD